MIPAGRIPLARQNSLNGPRNTAGWHTPGATITSLNGLLRMPANLPNVSVIEPLNAVRTVRLDRTFTLPVPPDEAFAVLGDARQLAAVVPGATLTRWDGNSFDATVRLRVGLLPLVGHGVGRIVRRDAAAARMVVEVARRGGPRIAVVALTVAAQQEHSRVRVLAELAAPAAGSRIGRSLVAQLGDRILTQASVALAASLAQGAATAQPAGAQLPAGADVAAADDASLFDYLPKAVAPVVAGAAGLTVAAIRYVARRQ